MNHTPAEKVSAIRGLGRLIPQKRACCCAAVHGSMGQLRTVRCKNSEARWLSPCMVGAENYSRGNFASGISRSDPANTARNVLISLSTKSMNARMRGVRCMSLCTNR
jgi:hypothetical protein